MAKQNTFIPENTIDNIQVPGMALRSNAGIPHHNLYKPLDAPYPSNLRIVSMIPGDRKVAGCFNSYRNLFKQNIIDNIRMFPGDPAGSPDDFFLRNFLKNWEFL